MQLDFQQFLMKLEKLTDMRPIPDKDFVETYIKAYYLTENDMEQFIKNHRVRNSIMLIIHSVCSMCSWDFYWGSSTCLPAMCSTNVMMCLPMASLVSKTCAVKT